MQFLLNPYVWGINRLKYHLARIACKDVVVCDKCPDEVTVEMASTLDAIREQSEKRERYKFETSMIGRDSMGPPNPSTGGSCCSCNYFPKKNYF